MNDKQHTRRVFCLGLDGGTWTILRPLLESGRMPGLAALARAGGSGVLHSTIPPITPAAWSTFMTGCNPGKHGIFDFQGYDRHTHQPFYVNATSLRVPTLWQLLSQHGKRTAVVDLPVTYPPPAINGVVISGLMTPGREATFTHPAGLRQELEQHLGYEWPLLKEEDESWGKHQNIDEFLRLMRSYLESRVQAALYLLQREQWDVMFLQLQCVDFLQHPLWKHLDRSHPAFREQLYEKIITQFFVPLDHALGRLLPAVQASLGTEALIAVLSDHGFQRHVKRAELNHWLQAHGYLIAAAPAQASWMRWVELIRKLDVLRLRGRLLKKSQRYALASKLHGQRINYEHSRFYAVSAFWGYLYAGPQAGASDYSALAKELLEWRDPENGQPIVRQVQRSGDCYSGDALERLPDMIVEPMPGYTFSSKTYFDSGRLLAPVSVDDFHVGTHAHEGIFLLAGPGVQTTALAQGPEAHLQDMMPTLLHWLGLPVPAHCDGRVRLEWFDQAETQSIRFENAAVDLQEEYQLSNQEKNEIERRLQMLGYV